MRKLTEDEIQTLTAQGCSAEDWNLITVSPSFSPASIKESSFRGRTILGSQEPSNDPNESHSTPFIIHSFLCGCVVDDDALVRNSNVVKYHIRARALVDGVYSLRAASDTSFGIGTEVSVINEGGGRQVPLSTHLSAQLAYVLALYTYRPALLKKMKSWILQEAKRLQKRTATIGVGAHLRNVNEISNVMVGDAAIIEGAKSLSDGCILSSSESPTTVGYGVSASHFVLAPGAKVTADAQLERVFVGQGAQVGEQFAATDSFFFANSQAFHGEGCSVFCGPFSVSHHKSTLLIASLVSFMNAGSNTNQSNHLYKLGPNHQGIAERGCKFASGSYVMWPALFGPFSMIMGHISHHPDTSAMPFSYVIGNEKGELLFPGASLHSAGTVRDALKWPRRDLRKGTPLLDLVNCSLFNPYVGQKMVKAIEVLNQLLQSAPGADSYLYNGLTISRKALKDGLELYQLALRKFLGDVLVSRLSAADFSPDSLQTSVDAECAGRWIDVAGMLVPQQKFNSLLSKVEQGIVFPLHRFNDEVVLLHQNFETYQWGWVVAHFPQYAQKASLDGLLHDWLQASLDFDDLLLADCRKEYAPWTMTGYGVDGDADDVEKDFFAVHEKMEDNPFVQTVKAHQEKNKKMADRLFKLLIPN